MGAPRAACGSEEARAHDADRVAYRELSAGPAGVLRLPDPVRPREARASRGAVHGQPRLRAAAAHVVLHGRGGGGGHRVGRGRAGPGARLARRARARDPARRGGRGGVALRAEHRRRRAVHAVLRRGAGSGAGAGASAGPRPDNRGNQAAGRALACRPCGAGADHEGTRALAHARRARAHRGMRSHRSRAARRARGRGGARAAALHQRPDRVRARAARAAARGSQAGARVGPHPAHAVVHHVRRSGLPAVHEHPVDPGLRLQELRVLAPARRR